MPRGRENTISRSVIPQNACLDALDVRLRLSFVLVVIIVVWVLGSGGRDAWLLLPAAGLAAQSSFRYLRVRL
ncbi:hypothetical protein RI578_41980 (plasmid) [Streptomyces sp. BB1-1-1]|uniref:hypothetical protein n=1 Tax=Streptomyces sp. BB1-1-1 TaxID=3074430 RepID=UPI002877BE8A|nr:hypothetical protein [Streptomyces sp. BB1-1-1]WND32905.1 hypothetical protein RI578_00650 [Streptomyces sp. BB1-1-1]WND40026.1 hypothetical protein RI578_39755 [Streptomyces sp. BB1-1-1]WND40860.1 hypothetical protein RI578_41980 [Streptomyces sp. BB1-1-1]